MASIIAAGTRTGSVHLFFSNSLQTCEIRIGGDTVNKVQFYKDGAFIHVAAGNRLYQISGARFSVGDCIGFPRQIGEIVDFCVHPVQPELYSISSDRTITLYDLRTHQPFHTYRHTSSLHSIEILPSIDSIITGDELGGIQLWSKRTGIRQADIPITQSTVSSIDMKPDESFLCCGTMAGNIATFSLKEARYVQGFEWVNGFQGGVTNVTLNDESQSLIAASLDGEISGWDYNGKVLKWHHNLNEDILCCEFLQNGSSAYAGLGDGTIREVTLQTGMRQTVVNLHGGPVQTISLWR